MRTLVDIVCAAGHVTRDAWRLAGQYPCCPECGASTSRCWTVPSATDAVHGEIDIVVRHGLCHPDGSPRRFESRQALRRAARAAGLTNAVHHIGVEGSDKSPHTQRFV
jgi:hypothetical protein